MTPNSSGASSSSSGSAGRAQLDQVLRAVQAQLRAGDMQSAAQIANTAVDGGVEHPKLLVLAAHHQLTLGAHEAALQRALRAEALAPRDVDALNVKGLCLMRLGRMREALPVYDAALRISPGAALVHFNKGRALTDLNALARAEREFERALQLQPAYAEALAQLANLAAQRGDAATARDYAARALKLDPQQTAARITLAQADFEEKKYDAALAALSALPSSGITPVNLAVAQGLMGDALDGLGRTGEAFAAYTRSSETQRNYYKPQFDGADFQSALSRVNKRIAYFREASVEDWRAKPSGAPPKRKRTHVFLVGFPRSGTTLLEQVLASHPAIETMEERDALFEAAEEFAFPPGGLDRLATLPQAALDAWRDLYWKNVADAGLSAAKPVFIDKMPLNTVLLCLVAKFFPEAKILFALRDPRDVVLSCFRRRFRMNAQMHELLTLSGAANYYAATMQLAELYREKLGLIFFDARYEALVSDFEGETAKLCAFLGVDYDERMRGFAQDVKRRGVTTPSAVQVARGLYTQGMEQWRHYAGELAPVMPVLAPWVARFGYSKQ